MNLGLILQREYESKVNVRRRHKVAQDRIISDPNRKKLIASSRALSVRQKFLNFVEGTDTVEGISMYLVLRGTHRNCPSCAKAIYHSSIYDCPWLTLCPIHLEPLSSICSTCGSSYKAAQPDCPECGHEIPLSVLSENNAFKPFDDLERLSTLIHTVEEGHRQLCVDSSTPYDRVGNGVCGTSVLNYGFPSLCTDIIDKSETTFKVLGVHLNKLRKVDFHGVVEDEEPEADWLNYRKAPWVREVGRAVKHYIEEFQNKFEDFFNVGDPSGLQTVRLENVYSEALETWGKLYRRPPPHGGNARYFWVDVVGWHKPHQIIPDYNFRLDGKRYLFPPELGRDFYGLQLLNAFKYILDHYSLFAPLSFGQEKAAYFAARQIPNLEGLEGNQRVNIIENCMATVRAGKLQLLAPDNDFHDFPPDLTSIPPYATFSALKHFEEIGMAEMHRYVKQTTWR